LRLSPAISSTLDQDPRRASSPRPAAAPGSTRPAAAPGSTRPAAAPGSTRPAAAPGSTRPAAAPGSTRPAAAAWSASAGRWRAKRAAPLLPMLAPKQRAGARLQPAQTPMRKTQGKKGARTLFVNEVQAALWNIPARYLPGCAGSAYPVEPTRLRGHTRPVEPTRLDRARPSIACAAAFWTPRLFG
jgi:hypothetical protein